jgi:Flp pilus assembly protein TadD
MDEKQNKHKDRSDPPLECGGLPHSQWAVCGLLALLVTLVFGQTVRYDFVNYDDGTLVYDNPMVTRGLSVQGIGSAFTANVANMWYPLTLISYMLDTQMYGPKPWGYHLTNVFLHAATSIILFLALRRMTGDLWASAMVALVFAIHPLRCEAVAWVGERKSPLSGLFFVSTIAAYVAYARRPFSLARYLAVAALFTLGLLAKPSLVTLPLVLLLLDYWPLGRVQGAGGVPRGTCAAGRRVGERGAGSREQGRKGEREKGGVPTKWVGGEGENLAGSPAPFLPFSPASLQFSMPITFLWLVLEKIPLLLLSAACSVAAVLSQSGNIATLTSVPIPARIANAVISYAVYLRQFFWPAGLAAVYPRSEDMPAWQVGVTCVVLAVLSAVALMSWRRQPAVLAGWLWYLGTLVPMIGLVPIGDHARADRYTYLPQIGLGIAVVWGVRWGVRLLLGQGPLGRRLCGAGGALLVAGLTACAWRQTTYWQNSETLWTHTLACTSKNFVAQRGLGVDLAEHGRLDEAIARYQQALEINPDYDCAYLNLGLALARRGQVDEAVGQYEKALTINPDYALAHYSLGHALMERGEIDKAIGHYRKAIEIKPDDVDAHYSVGNALIARGQVDEALAHFQRALEIKPDDAAILNNVAWIRATNPDPKFRNGVEAVTLAQRAIKLTSSDTNSLDTLAAAYAETGRFRDAVRTANEAVQQATAEGNRRLADSLRKRIELYSAGRPWRDSPPPGPAKGQ